jgi:hypothetical protein
MKHIFTLLAFFCLLSLGAQGQYTGGSCQKGSIDLNAGFNIYFSGGPPVGFGVSADFGLMPMLSLGTEGGMGFTTGSAWGYITFRPLFHFGAFFLPSNMDLQTGLLIGARIGKSADFLFDWEFGYKWWFSSNIALNTEFAIGTSASHWTIGVSFKLR